MTSRQVEWDKSRVWLARASFLLIFAFALLVAGSAFRPFLPIALAAGLIAIYAIVRFMWHVQRSANLRRREKGRAR